MPSPKLASQLHTNITAQEMPIFVHTSRLKPNLVIEEKGLGRESCDFKRDVVKPSPQTASVSSPFLALETHHEVQCVRPNTTKRLCQS